MFCHYGFVKSATNSYYSLVIFKWAKRFEDSSLSGCVAAVFSSWRTWMDQYHIGLSVL